MKTLGLALASCAAFGFALLTACSAEESEDDTEGAEAHIETLDPLEGAYVNQGSATPVRFIFRRGDGDSTDGFLGELELTKGKAQRVYGKIALARDALGTKFTLTPKNAVAPGRDAGAGDDAGAPTTDPRTVAVQAFSGSMHYIKVGKNSTILVRADAKGTTTMYSKVNSWCQTDDDCSSEVQRIKGLGCDNDARYCTTKKVCGCD